jgi:hypothetical protein
MGLRETFQNAAEAIFDAFDNVATSATYVSKGIERYNPTTGATTATDTEYVVVMFFGPAKETEGQDQVLGGVDLQAMIPGNDLTPVPKKADLIQKSGVTYEIIDITTDMAEALYTFRLKQP